MKERTSAQEKIYSSNGTVIDEVVIGSSSMRVFKLMEDDYVRLDFVKNTSTYYPIGAYIVDPIFGKFVIVEEQMPKYQESSDSYKYELKFVSEYMAWKNRVFMLTSVQTSTNTRVRKEATWSLTAKLSEHLDELINNIEVINGSAHGYSYNVSGADNALEVHTMSYNGMDVIDAMSELADAFECEWWVIGKVIYFGKCETDQDAMTLSIANGSVASMDIQDNRNTYANKVYVYGSTKNLPFAYRRELRQTATNRKTKNNIKLFNGNHDLTADMFPKFQYIGKTFSGKIEEEGVSNNGDIHLDLATNKVKGTITLDCEDISIDQYEITSDYINSESDVEVLYEIYLTEGVVISGVNAHKITEGTAYGYCQDGSARISGITISMPEYEVDLNKMGNMYILIKYSIKIDGASRTLTGRDEIDFDGIVKCSANISGDSVGSSIKAHFGGSDCYIMINPFKVQRYNTDGSKNDEYYSFTFCNEAGDKGDTYIPDGFVIGSSLTFDNEDSYLVPSAYYSTPYDDPSSLLSIGENRLRLPESTGDYLIQSGVTEANAVEAIISFDAVYPDGKLFAKSVTAEEKKDYTEYDGEETKSDWQWHEYTIDPYIYSNKMRFYFDKKFMLPESELKVRFLTPHDVGVAESSVGDGYKLAGMTFGAQFNSSSKTFTIVRNSDFGALLPNDILKPTPGDPFVLIGWNVYAMKELGLIDDAETRLLVKANEYMGALEESQFTFTCTMSSDWMFNILTHLPIMTIDGEEIDDANGKQIYVKNDMKFYTIPVEGQKVVISHGALKNNGTKQSRIIGYELKLDKPYDSPKYTIGETEAYSRLAKIEKEITTISK